MVKITAEIFGGQGIKFPYDPLYMNVCGHVMISDLMMLKIINLCLLGGFSKTLHWISILVACICLSLEAGTDFALMFAWGLLHYVLGSNH
jgi:hypothetical protein